MVQTMPILTIMGSQSSSRQTALWGEITGGLVFNVLVTLSAVIVFFRIDTLGGVSWGKTQGKFAKLNIVLAFLSTRH